MDSLIAFAHSRTRLFFGLIAFRPLNIEAYPDPTPHEPARVPVA